MRKTLAITLIAFSLAMMSSALLVKRVHNFLHPQQTEDENAESFSPFGIIEEIANIHGLGSEDQGTMEIYFDDEYVPSKEEKEIVQPVIETELTAEERQLALNAKLGPINVKPAPQQQPDFRAAVQQLNLSTVTKQTMESYSKNPKVQNFMQEMSGVISKEDIEKGDYLQIISKPEVRDIFMKYAQDKDFRDLINKAMQNKEIVQLANETIKRNEVRK
ncbi:MAG: hypothetical protein K6E94_06115 [Elusimicrobiaceae bacterium]|nr:hypothetical protein [Elusimicrobiaceae bacterium]